MMQAQNHVAYPVLHNFHSHLHREALAINLVVLDEALTILLLYGPDSLQPPKQEIYPLRFAITDYLATLRNAFIQPSSHPPGPFQLEQLKEYGIPLKQHNKDTDFKLDQIRYRRKVLLGMLENDGWHWDSIYVKSMYESFDMEHKREISRKESRQKQQGLEAGHRSGRII